MSDIITPDFGNVARSTWKKLEDWARDEQEATKVLAQTRLNRVKAASKDLYQSAVDGIGECYAEMPSDMYFRQLQNDKDFWKDPSNVKRFFKDNGEYMNAGYKI
jgi:hypothetical protein